MSYLRSPIAFAHRGGAALWPENTLAAFEGALALGYRYIETDVRMTRDGKIVCFHDETLERTTNGRGRVADIDYADLARLDAGHRFSPDGHEFPFRGQGLRVPTLEEALALHPDLRLNIEIKQRTPAMERALWEEIDRLDAHERLLVAAAHDPLVHRFRALRPDRPMPTSPGVRGVLRFWMAVRTGLCRFDRYPFAALQVPPTFRGLTIVDRAFVEAAHAHGIHVHVWTIDDPAEMRRLLDLGVDGVMTDRPDLLRDVMIERNQWN
ncbi:MAG TPA: glycerophosphodiester phosphodiesterase [Sandaracinaceae bacterium]